MAAFLRWVLTWAAAFLPLALLRWVVRLVAGLLVALLWVARRVGG